MDSTHKPPHTHLNCHDFSQVCHRPSAFSMPIFLSTGTSDLPPHRTHTLACCWLPWRTSAPFLTTSVFLSFCELAWVPPEGSDNARRATPSESSMGLMNSRARSIAFERRTLSTALRIWGLSAGTGQQDARLRRRS